MVRRKGVIAMYAPVLVVDDDSHVCTLVETTLEKAGYPVVTATNGDEALHLLRCGLEPAFILLDLHMPMMDARQFHWAQRCFSSFANVPVVLISATPDVAEIARALGLAGWLHK